MFQLLLPLVVFVAAVIFWLLNFNNDGKLPPSPPALPLIGHLHLIGSPPHTSMLNLSKRYGDLMFLKLGVVKSLVVSSPEVAKLVLKTHDHTFSSRPYTFETEYVGYKGSGLVLAPYGDNWRLARKLCTLELLTSKRVELAAPMRRQEMSLLLTEVWKNSQQGVATDLATKLSDFTFNIMLKKVINKSYSGSAVNQVEREEALAFKNAIIEMVRVSNGIHIASFAPWLKWLDLQVYKIKSVYKHLNSMLQKEIDERRDGSKQVARDFMGAMLSASAAGKGLSDMAIKAVAQDVVAGGTDTAANTAEWAITELLRHPEILARARTELDEVIGRERTMEEADIPKLKYLQAVVNETLRLHPPISMIPRENTAEDCQLGEYLIPAGTRVFINVYAIGRHEAAWNKPLEFDPERFLKEGAVDVRGQHFEVLPFGTGRRICPGLQLGLITVAFLVGALVHGFDWELPNGETAAEIDMGEHFGLTVAKAVPLLLTPTSRLPPSAYEAAA